MTEEEIIKEFVSIEEIEGEVVLSVRIIEWDGPHAPISHSVEVRRFAGHAGDDITKKAIKAVLRKKQFFGRCQECGELNPSGWMHDSKICQHCAETNHGVVY
jgi:hypothetical protein